MNKKWCQLSHIQLHSKIIKIVQRGGNATEIDAIRNLVPGQETLVGLEELPAASETGLQADVGRLWLLPCSVSVSLQPPGLGRCFRT